MKFWFGLSMAIVFEVIGVTFLNYSEGFSRMIPTTIAVFFYLSSIVVYMWNTKEREVGVVGALFAGIGTIIVLCVGLFLIDEQITLIKLFGIMLILTGVIRLSKPVAPKGVRSEEHTSELQSRFDL